MAEEEFVDVSFDKFGYIKALSRAALRTEVCITELIDNGLDANATHVHVSVKNGKYLRVVDNGDGVPDHEALVRFGGHVSHGRRDESGQNGVGLKESALVLGGAESTVKIETLRNGYRRVCTIEWSRVKDGLAPLRTGKPVFDDEGEKGTTIEICPLRHKFPEGADRDRLLKKLGYIYSPAIRSGKVIQVTAAGKIEKLSGWRLPTSLTDIIEADINIGGRRAKIKAGLVPAGEPNEYRGITYAHGYRVVKAASPDGCGEHSFERVCGVVYIDAKHGWERQKNKTDLVDAQDLYDEVERLLAPILQKASEHAHTLAFEADRASLESMLSEAWIGQPDSKGVRNPGKTKGTAKPTGKGGKHRRASETQPGRTFGGRIATSIRLEIMDGWSDGCKHGEFYPGKSARVVLYKDHPAIARAMYPWNSQALFILAGALIGMSDTNNPSGQQEAWTTTREALIRFASVIACNAASINGTPITEASE